MAEKPKDPASPFYSRQEQRALMQRYIKVPTSLDNIQLYRMPKPILESSPYDPDKIPKPGSAHPSKPGFIALATETYSRNGDNTMATVYFSPTADNGQLIDSRGEAIIAGQSQELLIENRRNIASKIKKPINRVADENQTISPDRVFAAIRFNLGISTPEQGHPPAVPRPSLKRSIPIPLERALEPINFDWNVYGNNTSAYSPPQVRQYQIEI